MCRTPGYEFTFALVLGVTVFGSLWAIADAGPTWAALAVTVGLAISLIPILLRVLPPLAKDASTDKRDPDYVVTVMGLHRRRRRPRPARRRIGTTGSCTPPEDVAPASVAGRREGGAPTKFVRRGVDASVDRTDRRCSSRLPAIVRCSGAALSQCARHGARASSESRHGADRDHGRAAGVDGVDDLGVVDALELDRGDAEVAVAELALDDDERHALVRHLDGVGVAKLVRREAPTNARGRSRAAQLSTRGGG